jgi:hypothetical protein
MLLYVPFDTTLLTVARPTLQKPLGVEVELRHLRRTSRADRIIVVRDT